MNSNRKLSAYHDVRPQDLEKLLRRGRALRSAYIADGFRAVCRRLKHHLFRAHDKPVGSGSPLPKTS